MTRERVVAKPRRGLDLRAITAGICERFSESLKHLASVDTHPEGGDVQQAPSLMGSAVPQADARNKP